MYSEELLIKAKLIDLKDGKSSLSTYTTNYTGDINILRSIEGRMDVWRTSINKSENVKKKIIISDWTINYRHNTAYKIEVLCNLLEQEFVIGIWTNAGLKFVTNRLDLRKTLFDIEPICESDLENKLTQLNVSRDECYICNFNRTEQLINLLNESRDSSSIKFYPELLPKTLSEDELSFLLQTITNEPPIEINIQDFDTYLSKESIQYFLQNHKNLRLIGYITPETLNKILKIFPSLTSLAINLSSNTLSEDSPFPAFPENLRSLEITLNFRVDSKILLNQLNQAIQHCPHLEILNIRNKNNNSGTKKICQTENTAQRPINNLSYSFPPSLRSLHLSNLDINEEQLGFLLHNCVNLVSFFMENNKEQIDNLSNFRFPPSLKSLKIVYLNNLYSINNLHYFQNLYVINNLYSTTNKCIELEELEHMLFSEKQFNKTSPSSFINLPLLNYLDKTDLTKLNSWLENFSSLKSLKLQKLVIDADIAIVFPPTLNSLQIEYSSLGTPNLALVKQCTQLKNLILRGIIHNTVIKNKIIELPTSLISLHFAQVEWDSEIIKQCIQMCPNLENIYLDFTSEKPISFKDWIFPKILKNLKVITNNTTTTVEGTFQQLIKSIQNIPHLKHLTFKGNIYIIDVASLQPLPSLIELDLSDSQICERNFNLFIAKLVNLKVLNINCLKEINYEHFFEDETKEEKEIKFLSHLKLPSTLTSLSLENLSCNSATINHLITQCPALTFLTIHPFSYKEGFEELKFQLKNIFPYIQLNEDGREADPLEEIFDEDTNVAEHIFSSTFEEESPDSNTAPSTLPLVAHEVFRRKTIPLPTPLKREFWPHPIDYRLYVSLPYINDRQIKFLPISQLGRFKTTQNFSLQKLFYASQNQSLPNIYEQHYANDPSVFLGEFTTTTDESGIVILPTLGIRDIVLAACVHLPTGANTSQWINISTVEKWDDDCIRIRFRTTLNCFIKIVYLLQSHFYSAQQCHLNEEVFNPPTDYQLSLTLEKLSQLKLDFKGNLINSTIKDQLIKLTPEQIYAELQQFFTHFVPKPLKLSNPLKNDFDLINTIINQRVGVCRHRTDAFTLLILALKKNVHPYLKLNIINARKVSNEIHTFSEVSNFTVINNEIKTFYQRVDLDGGESVVISKPVKLKNAQVIAENELHIKMKQAMQTYQPIIASPLSADNRFQTWLLSPIEAKNLNEYAFQLRLINERKLLIRLYPEQIEPLYNVLLQMQKMAHQQCFYLDDFKEMTATAIKVDNMSSPKRIDSPIVKFLKTAQSGDILLMNISPLKAEFLNSLNTILDDIHPQLWNIPIPPNLKIIILLRHDERLEKDLARRLPIKSECLKEWTASHHGYEFPEASVEQEQQYKSIYFFDEEWRSVLEGHIHINQDGHYCFTQLVFAKEAIAGRPVILKQAPWHLSSFRLYLTQLLIERIFKINGETHIIADTFTVLKSSAPYQFPHQRIKLVDSFEELSAKTHQREKMIYMLNPMMLYTFKPHYTCTEAGSLSPVPGIFAQHILNNKSQINTDHQLKVRKRKLPSTFEYNESSIVEDNQLQILKDNKLYVLVTHPLSDAQWAEWLALVEEYQVQIELQIAPGIQLPFALSQSLKSIALHSATSLYYTNDIDYGMHEIQRPHSTHHIISVNQLTQSFFEHVEIQSANHFLQNLTSKQEIKNNFDDEAMIIEDKLDTADQPRRFSHHLSSFPKEVCALNLSSEPPRVILKGQLSTMIAQQLSSACLPRPYLWLNGQLHELKPNSFALITDATSHLPFNFQKIVSDTAKIQQLLAEKFPNNNLLKCAFQLSEEFTALNSQITFNYSQLISLLHHLQYRPQANPLKSLLRLRANYKSQLKMQAERIWKKAVMDYQSELQAHAQKNQRETIKSYSDKQQRDLNQHRLKKIAEVFNYSPYAFLVGPSGTGKTTFVEVELKKAGYKIFKTMQQLKQWYLHGLNFPAILFFDEANLLPDGIFDQFESLFDNPPGIYIDGVFYEINDPLTSGDSFNIYVDGMIYKMKQKHIILFAGNFTHFADRQQHKFFDRHGAIITFGEFSSYYLEQYVIKLKLKTLLFDDFNLWEFYKASLLNFYQQINEHFNEKRPFTIRNIDMILLRLSVLRKGRMLAEKALALALYDESQGLNLTEKNSNRLLIQQWIKNITTIDIKAFKKELKTSFNSYRLGTFYVTKSRANLIRLFNQAMEIRKLRHTSEDVNVGVRAIVLEGETNIGKTLIFEEYLKFLGFKKAQGEHDEYLDNPTLYYYCLNKISDLKLKDIILKRAAKNGSIVLIDEMNTQSAEVDDNKVASLEGLLNPVLSGTVVHPLFMVFATQNPISYKNRKPFSDAFANRVMKINLKEYRREELIEIKMFLSQCSATNTKGIQQIEELVDEYLIAVNYARAQRKSPGPTAGDLFKYSLS